jgi:homoaconitase/3-isopropylmalate dehydratase large subunit
MAEPKTLFDKVWDQYVVTSHGGEDLLWIDRHFVHEGSHHAFRKLAERGAPVARPDLTFAVALEASPVMAVDLEACRYEAGSITGSIEIDALWRKKLLNGWEDVDLALEQQPLIRAYVARDAQRRPWAMPRVQA